MAVLPPAPELFPAPSRNLATPSKKMAAPATETVAAIAAGRSLSPRIPVRPKQPPRRTSSTTSAATAAPICRKDTQDKRANHNAIERARRESLNQRFLDLASQIPAISEVRRPSKSLIVNRSLQFVHDSLAREAMYRKMLVDLHDRTRVLTEQLNEYRIANGLQNYVESVPNLSLPVALADVAKDKPTARIVGRKNSTNLTNQEDDLAVDDYGMDDFDDTGLPLDDLSPAGLEDQTPFFSQPPSTYPTSAPVAMSMPAQGMYQPAQSGAFSGNATLATDVNGMPFYQPPVPASTATPSPVSVPDMSAVSPSSSSPATNPTFSPAQAVQPHSDSTANFKGFPFLNWPSSMTEGQPFATSHLTDFASLLGTSSYHQAP